MSKLIALTPGEPSGIGPDIVLASFASLAKNKSTPIVIADIDLLNVRAQTLNLSIEIERFNPDQNIQNFDSNKLQCLHVPLSRNVEAGSMHTANASYVLKCLDLAIEGCLNNKFAGMVTGPINKSLINDAGIPFSGHTEYLAECDKSNVVMMLATEKLRVALASTHLPLKDVSAAITEESLTETINILHKDLVNKFSISKPKIAVLGLNPHAGEGGHLGDEELNTIIPTLDKLRDQGLTLTGPLPADTAFNPEVLNSHDAVLAMYHDQGLPVLKYSGFGSAVNITLGLSFIRTSVDHGTALELAGSGKAKHDSLLAAYKVAEELAYV